jgi:signal transduction histidine kinase
LNRPENAQKILDLTADTMLLVHKNGNCIDINVRSDRWFLQDASYFLGKNLFRQIPSETAQALLSNFRKVLSTGQQSSDNYEVQVAGKTYYFKCILTKYDPDHILFQYRDITQRVLLKQRIEIINRRLQEVEKVARIGQWMLNHRTRNIQYRGYSGGLANSSDSKTISINEYLKYVWIEDRRKLLSFFERNMDTLNGESLDYQLEYLDQRFYFRLRIISSYINDDGDRILEGYIQNITDLMHKQHELEMITLAVQNSTDYIFAMQTDGKLVFCNRKFREFHNIPEEFDIAGTNFFETIVSESGKARWTDIIHQLVNTRETLNFVLPKPIPEKPDVLAFDCTSYLVQDLRGADQIWTFGKDITERSRYEKQIKELNQIMSTVLTNIPMNISVKDVDNDFRYIFSNRMGKKMRWGVQDEIIGKTDFELYTKEAAQRLRKDDLISLDTKEETRRVLLNKDANDNTVYFDQLRLLVEDESRSLLISIERDITKDKLMEQELINAKEKAEESDKLKSAFIANMSHEIRTPLNAIVGFSKIIAETQDPDERRSYYSIVDTNNGRLLGLINEILDLSKIESGIMEFDMDTTHLSPLCRDVQQSLALRCQPGVQLLFEEANPELIVHSDKNRLSQVLNNLIGNAIKFTKEGSIRFGYHTTEEWIEFYVTDTGSGIPEDKIDRVFDRFIKGDNFTQGTGLGLPICKSIVEKLGGSIRLESTFGKGSRFVFTLPADCILEQGESKEWLDGRERKSILVAEDTDSQYLLLESLIGTDYRLQRATNGTEAVSMLQESTPDLVLMDIRMPVLNGIDATRLIRSIAPHVPIVAVSAFNLDQDRNAAMEAGCIDFLSKPYTKTQLLDIIQRTLELQ